jgi:hypothetical protein
VQEWWNTGSLHYATPRQHLFEQLDCAEKSFTSETNAVKVGKGVVIWLKENPAALASTTEGDVRVADATKIAARAIGLEWRENNYLMLRRGPYLLAAGLDESVSGPAKLLQGRFVNLFDAELSVRTNLTLAPGSRFFLLDLDQSIGNVHAGQTAGPRVLASACKTLPLKSDTQASSFMVEGVVSTPAAVLIHSPAGAPRTVSLAGQPLEKVEYSASEHLVWLRFENQATARELRLSF